MKSAFYLLCGLLLLCLLPETAAAQKSARYYRHHPAWITMMDDSTTNYFEAVKAFDLFWKDKERPVEEDELMDKGAVSNEREKEEREHTAWKNLGEKTEFAYQYKRFMDWKLDAQSWIQPDGHILTMWERQQLYSKMYGKKEQK